MADKAYSALSKANLHSMRSGDWSTPSEVNQFAHDFGLKEVRVLDLKRLVKEDAAEMKSPNLYRIVRRAGGGNEHGDDAHKGRRHHKDPHKPRRDGKKPRNDGKKPGRRDDGKPKDDGRKTRENNWGKPDYNPRETRALSAMGGGSPMSGAVRGAIKSIM